jgi:murein DD-endopeptidase / murein LD-carboxypeptidase
MRWSNSLSNSLCRFTVWQSPYAGNRFGRKPVLDRCKSHGSSWRRKSPTTLALQGKRPAFLPRDRYPGARGVRGPAGGSNGQQYAYEFVGAFAYAIPALRSSGLWADTAHTATVERPEPFDLLLLNGKPDPWAAPVGVYLGKRLVLHLYKKIGVPAVESIESLTLRPEYHYLIGFKRILMNRNPERT